MSMSSETLSRPSFEFTPESLPQGPSVLESEGALSGDTVDTLSWSMTSSIGVELGLLDEIDSAPDNAAPAMIGSLALGHNEVIRGAAVTPDQNSPTRAFGEYTEFGFGELEGRMLEDAVPSALEYEATEPGEPQGVMAELLIEPPTVDELRTANEPIPPQEAIQAGMPPEEALALAA